MNGGTSRKGKRGAFNAPHGQSRRLISGSRGAAQRGNDFRSGTNAKSSNIALFATALAGEFLLALLGLLAPALQPPWVGWA
jgi:hypothetical protein